jgi:hypothetical protein
MTAAAICFARGAEVGIEIFLPFLQINRIKPFDGPIVNGGLSMNTESFRTLTLKVSF